VIEREKREKREGVDPDQWAQGSDIVTWSVSRLFSFTSSMEPYVSANSILNTIISGSHILVACSFFKHAASNILLVA
jgi:hypothetical protein